MKTKLHRWLLVVVISTTLADNEPDLPLCPTSPQFFPQKLPMHCRMPRSTDRESFPQFPTLPPLPESYFQSPSPDKQPPPIPIPIPPFPGIPGAIPMPGHLGGPMEGAMPAPMPGMPGPMPGMPGAMPMPVPMVGGPSHKLPVIVMPFYSQDHSFKKPQPKKPHKHRNKKRPPHKKRKKPHSSEPDTSSCEESTESDEDISGSSEHGFWKGRRKAHRRMARRFNKQHKMRKAELKNKKKNLLTPILQYVTKDGYVIFEKKISKNEAKDWLKSQTEMTEIVEEKREEPENQNPEENRQDDLLFNPKSAEEFFKLDEEDKRLKAMEISKETTAVEVTTKKQKRRHRTIKFNPMANASNEPS